jgi:hypothetical protein
MLLVSQIVCLVRFFSPCAAPLPALAEEAAPLPALSEEAAPLPALAEEAAPLPALAEEAAQLQALAEEAAPLPASSEEAAPLPALAEEAAPLPALAEEAAQLQALAEEAAPLPALFEEVLPPSATTRSTRIELSDAPRVPRPLRSRCTDENEMIASHTHPSSSGMDSTMMYGSRTPRADTMHCKPSGRRKNKPNEEVKDTTVEYTQRNF